MDYQKPPALVYVISSRSHNRNQFQCCRSEANDMGGNLVRGTVSNPSVSDVNVEDATYTFWNPWNGSKPEQEILVSLKWRELDEKAIIKFYSFPQNSY